MISRTHAMARTSPAAHPLLYIRYMTKALHLLLALPLVACVVGTDQDPVGPTPGDDDPMPDPNPNPDPTGLFGSITSDLALTGNVKITGALSIEAGATVTVAPGTQIEITTATVAISVKGTLDVQGAKGQEVVIQPTDPLGHWGGISVSGTYRLSYGSQIGGGIRTSMGSTTTIVDSTMARSTGDYIVMGGGALDVQYSNLGLETGDTTHCNMHLNAATSIRFTNNNNAGAPYGLMYYASSGDFKHNNWITTPGQFAVEPNNMGPADFSESYFSNGQPTGTQNMTYNALSPTRLTDVGPR